MKRTHCICILVISFLFSVTSYGMTGWQEEDGWWKYYRGSDYQDGFTMVNGVKYYFDESGRMQTGWQEIGGHWYLFLADGAMHTGWWQEGDTWYYLMLDGIMLKEGYAPDGHWMDSSGRWTEAVSEQYDYRLSLDSGKYILNWETDVNLVGDGMSDMEVVFALYGLHDAANLNEKEKATYDAVKTFIDNQIKDTDTDYDKVVKITKFIWQKAAYQQGYSTPYDLLIEGKAVCEGYAQTFKLMANAVGLECYVVTGINYGGLHAWNKVRVDGEWYHADLTEPIGGYKASEAAYILRCEEEYSYTKIEPNTPDCTATKYSKSNID